MNENDFRNLCGLKTISSYGSWCEIEPYGRGYYNNNMSDIYSELLVQAVRMCDKYQSDILYSIQRIYSVLKTYQERQNHESNIFLFGFRDYGVDDNYIVMKKINDNRIETEYRKICALYIWANTSECYAALGALSNPQNCFKVVKEVANAETWYGQVKSIG